MRHPIQVSSRGKTTKRKPIIILKSRQVGITTMGAALEEWRKMQPKKVK